MTSTHRLQCPSWEHFTELVRDVGPGRVGGSRVFRGHADPNWKLASKFERWLDDKRGNDPTRPVNPLFGPGGLEGFENGYLTRFKAHGVGLPGLATNDLAEDDWWALGRHHGLVTRLLDWTARPYIAAFFAFADFANRWRRGYVDGLPTGAVGSGPPHVVIWALAPYRDLQVGGEFEILQPRRDQFRRQRAQAGLYTRLRHELHLDLAAYLVSKNAGHYLEEFHIPSSELGKAMTDMTNMNITYSTLFPDLNGAARDANLPAFGNDGVRVTLSL